MGHTVSEGWETHLSLPCLHQEGRIWEISANLYQVDRTSASYTQFLKFSSGINMHEQSTRQAGVSYAIERHSWQEHIDGAFCKEIEQQIASIFSAAAQGCGCMNWLMRGTWGCECRASIPVVLCAHCSRQ